MDMQSSILEASSIPDKNYAFSQSIARELSYAMASAFIAVLLIEHAAWPGA